MTDFKVTKSGWYRTRDGSEAEILYNPNAKILNERVTGYFPEGDCRILTWTENGTVYKKGKNILDLIEYLGKERPKRKKTIKMAPALIVTTAGDHKVSSFLFESEDEAKKLYTWNFVRWLIDSHAVEREVPDNG